MLRNCCFNPRARTGRDAVATSDSLVVQAVSIHAPARGATSPRVWANKPMDGFNPRARTGRDKLSKLISIEVRCFNPRARTGRDRHRQSGGPVMTEGFNPRARTGRDLPTFIWMCWISSCFNPRARTGRDCCSVTQRKTSEIVRYFANSKLKFLKSRTGISPSMQNTYASMTCRRANMPAI